MNENYENLICYYNSLVESVKSTDIVRRLNSDRIHNAIIMRVILENTKQVKMFCGELSVFRSSFADKVNSSIQNLAGTDLKQFDPINDLKISLSSFLSKSENDLYVVLENPDEDFWNDSIIKEIILKHVNENVHIYKLRKGVTLFDDSHFTVGDNKIYRIETDKDTHEAICCVNNTDGSNEYIEMFKVLLESATEPFYPLQN